MSFSAPDSAHSAPERIFWVAIWGNVALAGLGVLFGLVTRSHVILLDGVLSGLNSLIALMARQVNRRLAESQSDRLPFGDAALEPLLQVLRGAVSLVVYGFAGLVAIAALGSGGRAVRAALAVLYGVVAALGGMILANYQGKQVQGEAEPPSSSLSLGAVDARHWFVEGAMGLVIALVFAIVYLAGDRDPGLLHYVDPILVLGVVWLSVRSPWGLARQGWFEMLERSGDRRLQQRIRKLLDRPIRLIPHDSEVLRVGRFGRITYIQLYLIVSPQNELTRHVLAHDRIRQLMYDHLYKTFHDAFALEVIITSDRRWAEHAIGQHQSPP
ncbi:cation transporter [Phormidium yuhuli AB48]|uniref:Cation transporter n=1 Tax=Phormidium yuhuli AB48 TaxID=2940671 RepID=A0ABY5AT89_9CYAN|nr:cation transporter [Phormidium yuhuli]USR92240.1 cation transporter [Phormidium yuhuli AB48]